MLDVKGLRSKFISVNTFKPIMFWLWFQYDCSEFWLSLTYPLSLWYFKASSSTLWSYEISLSCVYMWFFVCLFVCLFVLYHWSTFSLRFLIYIFEKFQLLFLQVFPFLYLFFHLGFLLYVFDTSILHIIEASINDFFQSLKLPWCPSQRVS